MKNSLRFLSFLVTLTILFSACQVTTNNDELDYTPGEVLISLENETKETEIKQRIEDLDLEWKEYFKQLGAALIGVPVGEEEFWIQVLRKEPLIRNAQLNRNVEPR